MQQVYTDETGKISVSMPMNLMKQEGSHNVAEEFRLPTEPSEAVKEPNPADFGLNDCPQQPVKPENMNPNIWSWIVLVMKSEKLMNAEWVKDVKDTLRINCNLDTISTMDREKIGQLLSSQIAFRDAFRQQAIHPQPEPQAVMEELPVREEAAPNISI